VHRPCLVALYDIGLEDGSRAGVVRSVEMIAPSCEDAPRLAFRGDGRLRQTMNATTRALLLAGGTRGGRRPGDEVIVAASGAEAGDRAGVERPLRRAKGATSFEPRREGR
jgi:hypothetical protein